MEEYTYTGTMSQIKAKVQFLDDWEGTYELTIKPYRRRRSYNANAYLWALIGKIADVLREDKELVYEFMLRRYGQGEVIEIRSDINPMRYFKYIQLIGEAVHDGNTYRQYRVWRGTSEYDTREMSIMIDGVINEATALGIPTIGDEEAERLKSAWGR